MRAWRLRLVAADGGVPAWRAVLVRYAVGTLSLLAVGAGFWWAWIDRPQRAGGGARAEAGLMKPAGSIKPDALARTLAEQQHRHRDHDQGRQRVGQPEVEIQHARQPHELRLQQPEAPREHDA